MKVNRPDNSSLLNSSTITQFLICMVLIHIFSLPHGIGVSYHK
uniref:Uncharacterized protein n=1 Tax=Arundo donax TaxID=35708 RepID=A0A0A9FB62_ARUDO